MSREHAGAAEHATPELEVCEPEPEVDTAPDPARADAIMQGPAVGGVIAPDLPGAGSLHQLELVEGFNNDEVSLDAVVGQSHSLTISIRNPDAVERELDEVSVTGSEAFSVASAPKKIAPAATVRVELRFAASSPGVVKAWLNVMATQGPSAAMPLIARVQPRPEPKRPSAPAKAPQQTRQPTRAPSTASTVAPGRFAAPSQIDLGDVELDRTARRDVFVYSLTSPEHQGPRVQARIVGDPSVTLVGAPLFVPGAGQVHDDSSAFELACKPTRSGPFAATLEIEVTDAPGGTLRVPITGAGHAAGTPTQAEQKAAETERVHQAEADARAAAEARKAEEIIRNDTGHHHEPAQRDLDGAMRHAVVAGEALTQSRRDGVQQADDEIGEFVRASPPPPQSSVIDELAGLALDMATAGIAGSLARRLEPIAIRLLQGPDETKAGPLVAFFTDGLKQGVKGARAIAAARLEGDHQHSSHPAGVGAPNIESKDPKARFLGDQRAAITNVMVPQWAQVIEKPYRLLGTMLTTNRAEPDRRPPAADKAIEMMTSIGEQLQAAQREASDLQADETVRHWVSYVAQRSVGSVDSDAARRGGLTPQGENVPVMSAAHASAHPATRFDGVLDIEATSSQTASDEPIAITRVRLEGVKRAVVERLKGRPLAGLGIPLRIVVRLTDQTWVCVTRDEAGNVAYTDNSVGVGATGTWLARRAGVRATPQPIDTRRGAELLVQQIARNSIDELLPTGDVENDSARG